MRRGTLMSTREVEAPRSLVFTVWTAFEHGLRALRLGLFAAVPVMLVACAATHVRDAGLDATTDAAADAAPDVATDATGPTVGERAATAIARVICEAVFVRREDQPHIAEQTFLDVDGCVDLLVAHPPPALERLYRRVSAGRVSVVQTDAARCALDVSVAVPTHWSSPNVTAGWSHVETLVRVLVQHPSAACRTFLVGTVPLGEPCDASDECAGDAYCDTSAGCPGACRPRLPRGSACEKSAMCSADDGGFVRCALGHCEPRELIFTRATALQSCGTMAVGSDVLALAQCEEGLSCVRDRCQVPTAEGSSCGSTEICEATTVCVLDCIPSRHVGLGERCGEDAFCPPWTTVCASGSCVVPSECGAWFFSSWEPIVLCPDDLVCSGSCRPPLASGETCSVSSECASLVCDDGRCTATSCEPWTFVM